MKSFNEHQIDWRDRHMSQLTFTVILLMELINIFSFYAVYKYNNLKQECNIQTKKEV